MCLNAWSSSIDLCCAEPRPHLLVVCLRRGAWARVTTDWQAAGERDIKKIDVKKSPRGAPRYRLRLTRAAPAQMAAYLENYSSGEETDDELSSISARQPRAPHWKRCRSICC